MMNHKDNVKFPVDLPLGEWVGDSTPAKPPERKLYEGRYVNLAPVDPEKDAAELYRNSHGSQEKYKLWTYMAYGPFSDEAGMQDWLRDFEASTDTLFLTVRSKEFSDNII